MALMNEYISKRMSGAQLEVELLKLIAQYNKLTGSYLLVYAGALTKPVPQVSMGMDDYFTISDMLQTVTSKKLDIYIETPGGSGEAAEEIVNCFRSKFDEVNFVVSGESKSAGTLVVLSGNNIGMTNTGSLGPIDAQMVIGRGNVSAHDYMEWVISKQEEAKKAGSLNPFDATMVAQITPGELNGVSNALEFAHDLVVKWLPKYKFKDWDKTETRHKVVTQAMKERQAKKIAQALTNHTKWRSHGRSLKIADLQDLGLKINAIDDDPKLSDVVHRLQVVIKLLFNTTSTYKMFATESGKIFNTATQGPAAPGFASPEQADNVQLELTCPKCGIVHKLYAKLVDNKGIDKVLSGQGYKPFPPDSKLTCKCGFEMDLTGMKNDIEANAGRKMVQ